MLANAVSSAVERLYAAKPVGDDRAQVSRVSAVAAIPRLKVVGQNESDREAEVLEERDRLQHRQALTRGVLAVFEATGTSADSLGPEGGVDGADRTATDTARPDPQLEEAILRFIHTVFRNLPTDEPVEVVSAADPASRGATGGVSREALGARIEALARKLSEVDAPAGADAAGDPADDTQPAATPRPPASARPGAGGTSDTSLEKAFAEVVQALHGNLGALSQSPTTRAELVSMMQRLALAMHGTPPIDPGLPTRGGLLSERA